MPRVLAILAALSLPYAAHAQVGTAYLSWDEGARATTEALVVIRDIEGAHILTLRNDVEEGAQSLTLEMPPLPRAANSIQAGLIDEGRVVRQSLLIPVSDRAANGPELQLRASLALGFHDIWHCDDGLTYELTEANGTLHLQHPAGEWLLRPDDAEQELFRSEDGTSLRFTGNDAELTKSGGEETPCQPGLFRPLLPLESLGRDQSWRIMIGAQEALIDLPGLEAEAIRESGLTAAAWRDGQITIRGGDLRFTLTSQRCSLDARGVIYPFSASMVHGELSVSSEGCGGSPLRLIDGASWYVDSIFGIPLATDKAEKPPMTLQIAEAQISGRGTCNRYVGSAQVEMGQLTFTDLGTTRLACPIHRQNLELRFLDALEVTTGFDLTADGRLILLAGNIPVLTAFRGQEGRM